MKTVIKKVSYNKEVDTKGGAMHSFFVEYDDKRGSFLCKDRENPTFKEGEEAEFTETEREVNGIIYYNIRKLSPKFQGNSNFGKALKREQSKYSGFAMSYAKDLVIAGKIELSQISDYTKKMFELMVQLDKTLEA